MAWVRELLKIYWDFLFDVIRSKNIHTMWFSTPSCTLYAWNCLVSTLWETLDSFVCSSLKSQRPWPGKLIYHMILTVRHDRFFLWILSFMEFWRRYLGASGIYRSLLILRKFPNALLQFPFILRNDTFQRKRIPVSDKFYWFDLEEIWKFY